MVEILTSTFNSKKKKKVQTMTNHVEKRFIDYKRKDKGNFFQTERSKLEPEKVTLGINSYSSQKSASI